MANQIPFESALAVLVPEVESLVQPFRIQFDPSAAVGIPAHVTILYPFKPPDEITPETVVTLQELFADIEAFTVSFSQIERLPRVIYLAPFPDEPFRNLTEAVWDKFPEAPPYGGQFAEVIPHLTIAQNSDADRLAEIATEIETAATGVLPIDAAIGEVVLLDSVSGFWELRHRFALGTN